LDVTDSDRDDHDIQAGVRSAHPYAKQAIPGAREHARDEVPGCVVKHEASRWKVVVVWFCFCDFLVGFLVFVMFFVLSLV
jgi:hypothetical protein